MHRALGGVFICLGAVALCLAPGRASEPAPRGSLLGKVVGADGKPVKKARVSTATFDPASFAKKIVVEAVTDAEGRFRLGPVQAFYRNRASGLFIDADGFARLATPAGTLTVFPGVDLDLGTIRIERGRLFTGQVLDSDGKPRQGAIVRPRVYRLELGHTVNEVGTDQTIETDAQGRFRLPPLPVGRLTLEIRAPGRQLAIAGRQIAPDGVEDLGVIRLKEDVPVTGLVQDDDGRPISGATIGGTVGFDATTDNQGKFTLRGFGPNPEFQLNVSKMGYAGVTGNVTVTDAGVRYRIFRGTDESEGKLEKSLVVVLKRAGWFVGRAVDAETGAPVRLERVVICNFERKPNGEPILRGCRNDAFEQSEAGRFRVSFPVPDEYHLTLTAAGYHDGEAYTPKATSLETIGGIVVRMTKKTESTQPTIASQTVAGTVTRDGVPVKAGWIGLWALAKPRVAANAPVMRGRTAEAGPLAYECAPIRDGAYSVSVPFQSENWYLVAEEPGQPLTQVGPISVGLNAHQTVDIACTQGARIRGRVRNIPAGWEGQLWVIAFNKTAVREEARVDAHGEFAIPPLPPGEYGLKVGHDAYEDAETFPRKLAFEHPESFKIMANPWKRAKVVRLVAGGDVGGVELELPADGPSSSSSAKAGGAAK
jgi:Carboxypeptidase regulatory-like domain